MSVANPSSANAKTAKPSPQPDYKPVSAYGHVVDEPGYGTTVLPEQEIGSTSYPTDKLDHTKRVYSVILDPKGLAVGGYKAEVHQLHDGRVALTYQPPTGGPDLFTTQALKNVGDLVGDEAMELIIGPLEAKFHRSLILALMSKG